MKQEQNVFYLHPMGEMLDENMIHDCKTVTEKQLEKLIGAIANMIPKINMEDCMDVVFSLMEHYRNEDKKLYDLFIDVVNATNGPQILSLGLQLKLMDASLKANELKKNYQRKYKSLKQQYLSMFEMNNIVHLSRNEAVTY